MSYIYEFYGDSPYSHSKLIKNDEQYKLEVNDRLSLRLNLDEKKFEFYWKNYFHTTNELNNLDQSFGMKKLKESLLYHLINFDENTANVQKQPV